MRQIARMKKIKNKLNTGEFLVIESNDHVIKRSFVSSRVSKNTTDKQESGSNKLGVNVDGVKRKKSNRLNTLNLLNLSAQPKTKIVKSMARKETIDSIDTSHDFDPIPIKININRSEQPIVDNEIKSIEVEKPLNNLDSEKQIEKASPDINPALKLDLTKVKIMAEGSEQSTKRASQTLRDISKNHNETERILTPRPEVMK